MCGKTGLPLAPPEGGKGEGGKGGPEAPKGRGGIPARREKRELYHAGRLKKYPDGNYELLVCDRPIFREKGWEERYGNYIPGQTKKRTDEDCCGPAEAAEPAESAEAAEAAEAAEEIAAADGPNEANRSRAARRAKVRDLALCNDFRWFVTLTLDQDKIDRYDPKEITKKLNTWLDNQVRRNGLLYVLVAERHKDGAIHFHGMINEVPGIVPSGTWSVPGHKKPIKARTEAKRREWAARDDCHEVFNWLKWPLGFSTAIRLYGDYSSAVAYVCKYIRKQTGPEGPVGGRWYYHGGKLRMPEVELLDLGLQEVMNSSPDLYTFTVAEAGLSFGILRGTYTEFENDFTKSGL